MRGGDRNRALGHRIAIQTQHDVFYSIWSTPYAQQQQLVNTLRTPLLDLCTVAIQVIVRSFTYCESTAITRCRRLWSVRRVTQHWSCRPTALATSHNVTTRIAVIIQIGLQSSRLDITIDQREMRAAFWSLVDRSRKALYRRSLIGTLLWRCCDYSCIPFNAGASGVKSVWRHGPCDVVSKSSDCMLDAMRCADDRVVTNDIIRHHSR